jgi:hypothetical protein
VADVSQGVAEVLIGSCSGGTAGSQGRGNREGRERQAAFAPPPGSEFVDDRFVNRGFRGCGFVDSRRQGGRGDGDSSRYGGRRHECGHCGGRPGALRRQGTKFQQYRAEVCGIVHAGVGQQVVDDLLVPG